MSLHAKRNYRPRPRVLGTVTGVALLLGGGFAAQAVADSGVRPAPAAPKVATTGDAAPEAASKPGVSKPTGTPKVVDAGKPADAGKPGAGPAPAENAPRVIQPGSGVQK
ncbi:hypothetical protein QMK19_20955 [Streptomyces sp. H10-C2]|uniref:hypothetical protein n=1 Tax=unclassified Streptomyces TaxID=2593676 RepID=UPI0024BAAB70|nr:MULTISPECIES: hypothetical protein [unclassified Streptomyces]MDJ0344447.1 hypothetical protein [Streptomyces sp. PH10-H1]MDJ0372077.1 hypothetical protein [Streptomyces sp. H10-C2]